MKTLGLIGGMSWESTVTYYQLLNRGVREALGGLHSAQLLLWSFDFADIEACQMRGDWARATELMLSAAKRLERAGADALMICTNTMHRMADDIERAANIPLLHIADATAYGIRSQRVDRPLLLGTQFTMEQDFYKGRLRSHHDIGVVIPDETDRRVVHDVIYDELCVGEINPKSKLRYLELIERQVQDGADGVILGCTEIGLLIKPDDVSVPVFDTTAEHVRMALDFALSD